MLAHTPGDASVGGLGLDVGNGLGIGAGADRVLVVVVHLDLDAAILAQRVHEGRDGAVAATLDLAPDAVLLDRRGELAHLGRVRVGHRAMLDEGEGPVRRSGGRSEEHTSALQSLTRSSYAAVCLKKQLKPIHTVNYA